MTIRKNEVYTLQEAAELLKVSESTIRRRIREGSLPSVKMGRIRRIRGEDILGYVERSIEDGGSKDSLA